MSKTYPSIKFTFRDYTRKDGNRNIFLRLTINRKCKYFPLNIYVKPDHFKKGTITQADQDHRDKNSLIEFYNIKAKKILFDYRIEDKILTFERFQSDFLNSSYGSNSFYDFYERQISLFTDKLAKGSIHNYNIQLRKLKEYKPVLTFDEINPEFITAYEGYLKVQRQNNKNTVIKSLTIIKSILNKAVDQGIIKENPFKVHKLGRIEGDRQFLSQNELDLLEQKYYGNNLRPSQQGVLRYYLFCCFTGLRYQDVKRLRFKDILEDKYIYLQMGKTKEFVRIPLTDKAKKLIPERGFDNQPIFKVQANQPLNRKLKEIMKGAGIQKNITFHCSRHTCATRLNANGVPIDVISKILGHTNIKTTMIYTRYELDYLTREMNKMNTHDNPGKTE
jgi:integrase